MNIGSKEIFEETNSYSAKDYAQDGLIAMWDGIENIGFGKHDNNATIWKDLVGNHDANLTTNGHFEEDALMCNGLAAASSKPLSVAPLTIECVAEFKQSDLNQLFWSSGIAKNNCYYGLGTLTNNRGIIGYNACYAIQYDGKVHSVSLAYDTDVFLDGKHVSKIGSNTWDENNARGHVICFGSFLNNAQPIFNGRIKCIRAYSQYLTSEQRLLNYNIDAIRFKLNN